MGITNDKIPQQQDPVSLKYGDPNPKATKAQDKGAHVFIKNKHTAPLGLPPSVVKLSADEAKTRGIDHEVKHADKALQPGVNKVKAEHWNAAKSNPVVSAWLEKGYLEESSEDDSDVGGSTNP